MKALGRDLSSPFLASGGVWQSLGGLGMYLPDSDLPLLSLGLFHVSLGSLLVRLPTILD